TGHGRVPTAPHPPNAVHGPLLRWLRPSDDTSPDDRRPEAQDRARRPPTRRRSYGNTRSDAVTRPRRPPRAELRTGTSWARTVTGTARARAVEEIVTEIALRAEGLYKVFGRQPHDAVARLRAGAQRGDLDNATAAVIDASFEVRRGEIFVVMG